MTFYNLSRFFLIIEMPTFNTVSRFHFFKKIFCLKIFHAVFHDITISITIHLSFALLLLHLAVQIFFFISNDFILTQMKIIYIILCYTYNSLFYFFVNCHFH